MDALDTFEIIESKDDTELKRKSYILLGSMVSRLERISSKNEFIELMQDLMDKVDKVMLGKEKLCASCRLELSLILKEEL